MTVDPIAAFKLRCEARAHLYDQADLDLHDAVDPLVEGAPKSLSVDQVQAIMAAAFRPVREKEWAEEKPPPVKAIEFDPPAPTKLALRDLWLAAMAVRDKGDRAKLQRQLLEHARTSGLIAAAGDYHASGNRPRHWSEEDVAHVISWGLRGMSPWHPGEFPNE